MQKLNSFTNIYVSGFKSSQLAPWRQLESMLTIHGEYGTTEEEYICFPQFVNLKSEDEQIECIRYGHRYFTIPLDFRPSCACLILQVQLHFLNFNAQVIDDLIQVYNNAGDSEEYSDAVIKCSKEYRKTLSSLEFDIRLLDLDCAVRALCEGSRLRKWEVIPFSCKIEG